MGLWDSIKGGVGSAWDGVGSAWDQTGGQVWDAVQNFEGFAPEGSPADRAGEAARGFVGGINSLIPDLRPSAATINFARWLVPQFQVPQTEPVISGPTIYGPGVTTPTREQFEAANESLLSFEEGQGPSTGMDPFARPGFDPTAITGPYGDYVSAANTAFDNYAAMLEGISTGPRTSRIDEMYAMALAEARRRGESADTWEATETARLDVSDEALDAALIDMQDKFGDRLTTIREGTTTRQAETADLRDGLIESTAGELGEASAAFIVQATRSGDILESQRSRNEQHMADMDGLYSMWSLDRTMDAAGMKQSARRDLADDVMAMREMIHQFSYGAGQQRLERLQVAEEGAAQRETEMLTTLAELGYGHAGRMADVGLQGALAVAGAEDEFDTKWDEAEAYWENPVTANAFFGMDPSMMGGADPQQMFENWLAIQQMQAGAAGDAVGPLWQDPIHGLPWADLYSYDPVSGQYIPNAKAIGQVSEPLGMAPSDLTSRLASDMADLNSAGI